MKSRFICGTGDSRPKDNKNAPTKQEITAPLNPNVHEWTNEEVLMWIESISQQEYRRYFQKAGIGGRKLLKLSKEDLKNIVGIKDESDRRKIRTEIIKLSNRPNDNSHKSHKSKITNRSNLSSSYNDPEHRSLKSNRDPRQPEFSNDPPLGRAGPYGGNERSMAQFENDKKQDKRIYFELWRKVVEPRDVLIQTHYNVFMKGTQLAIQDISLIWQLATHYNQGRCQFEQFVDVMKLTSIALSGIPLYLINTQKLIWYHPPLPQFVQGYQPQRTLHRMQEQQATKNTVAFRGIPPQILESDERLMKFAENALQQYDPVHFEINEQTLIATFKNQITPRDLETLHQNSIDTIQRELNIGNVYLKVDFPNAQELGMTPGGPQNGVSTGQYNGNNDRDVMHSPYGQNPNYISDDPYNVRSNGSNPHLNTHLPPPPIPPSHQQYQHNPSQPNGNYQNGNNNYMNGGRNGQINGLNNSPMNTINNSMNNGHGMNGTMNGVNGHQQHQQQQQQSYGSPQQTMQSIQNTGNNGNINEMVDTAMSPARKEELQELLLSENFWEDFRIRTQIDQLIQTNEAKIRTKAAMQIVARLRRVPLKAINYLDGGVQIISGRTKPQLEAELQQCSLMILGTLLDIPEKDIPEVYKGIIIEGLPEKITADDETIRKLDSAVLFSFIVSHIEVVDNVLRITFKKDVTQNDIDKLRRELKKFLRDDMKLDKKSMKNVSLIPHTRDTWRGETTTSEYDDDMNQTPYGDAV